MRAVRTIRPHISAGPEYKPRTAGIVDSLILAAGFLAIGYTLWNEAAQAHAST